MGKTVIGNLVATLSAPSSAFASGMHKAAKAVGRFGKMASIAGGLAGVGLAIAVKAQFKSIDATAKLSDQTGFATQSLQAYTLGAKLSGVETGLMEKSLVRMSIAMHSAKDGTGEAADAFRMLGLDIEHMRSLSPERQLEAIADGLASIGDPVTRQGIAASIFGAKGGPTMLRMLAGGSKGLKGFEAEARRAGLTISRFDAAKIELMNDSFTRLQAGAQGFAQRIAVWVAPGLDLMIRMFDEMATTANSVFGNMMSGLKSLGDVIVTVSALIDQLVFDSQMETKRTTAFWGKWLPVLKSTATFDFDGLEKAIEGLNKTPIDLSDAPIIFKSSERTKKLADDLAAIKIEAWKKAADGARGFNPLELAGLDDMDVDAAGSMKKASDFEQTRLGRIARGVSVSKPAPVEEKNSGEIRKSVASTVRLLEQVVRQAKQPQVLA